MSGNSPITPRVPLVLVLSGDARVRSGLERMLAERGVMHTSEAADAEVALLDRSSSAGVPQLEIPIVALVDPLARPTDVLAEGASAVLPNDASPERITAAAWAVSQGLVVVDHDMARRALPEPRVERDELDIDDPGDLTAREQEVLALVASGLSNRRIAAKLAISEHTAKFHVSAIFAKLGVSTRAESVAVAARRGLLWL